MAEKQFKIIDKQFISYYGGDGHQISDGDCKFWLWHNKEESQKVCDKLNKLLNENEKLKEDMIFHLQEIGSKHEIEKMEEKYNFDYSEELYKADTKQRIKMGLEPLRRNYYD